MMNFFKKISVPRTSVKLSVYGLLLFCIFAIQIVAASVYFEDGSEITGDKLFETMNNTSNLSSTPFPIQFFYNTHCGSCQEAVNYLNEFVTKRPEFGVEFHDLYNSSTNSTTYDQYKAQFSNNANIHYPVVFIGNVAIVGSYDIASYTESLSDWYQKNSKADLVTGILSSVINIIPET